MTAYLVAHPDSLVSYDTIEAARAAADKIRETKPVKIFCFYEVEHICPSGPPAPDPTLPPTGAAVAGGAYTGEFIGLALAA